LNGLLEHDTVTMTGSGAYDPGRPVAPGASGAPSTDTPGRLEDVVPWAAQGSDAVDWNGAGQHLGAGQNQSFSQNPPVNQSGAQQTGVQYNGAYPNSGGGQGNGAYQDSGSYDEDGYWEATADDGDQDYVTVRRDEVSASRPSAAPDAIGPMIAALVCPVGHANPPTDVACRWCGAPLPQEPVLVPRPALGVLITSLGDVITLDRDVIMGRNPSADFDHGGEERPHVVKLPSADGDISRNHLRVSLDGWHVLVTDLNSTNGTLITLPGRDAQQLRPGEPMPIPPGTVVSLAEGIDFRYKGPE
jgi:hypothetical protein